MPVYLIQGQAANSITNTLFHFVKVKIADNKDLAEYSVLKEMKLDKPIKDGWINHTVEGGELDKEQLLYWAENARSSKAAT